jgi:WD40 repeat protein
MMIDPTQRPTPLPEGSGGRDDPARRLWHLWSQGQRPEVDDFLEQAGIRDPERIVRVLRIDQRERSRLGQWIPAEAYIDLFPGVSEEPEHAVDLVFAEYLLREERGEQPALEEYMSRFPRYADELKLQIELHLAMGADREFPPTWAENSAARRDHRKAELLEAALALPNIPGYEILEVLGWGGMGVVYRALQQGLNRPVALKMVLAGAQASPQVLARLRVEARAVGRLQHPNIVQIHDVGEHAGSPYLVLELVEGRSLGQWLLGTPRPGRQAAEMVETLARAIHSAHLQGVVHRDLTPANILLTADLTPKITDFGLAKLVIGGGDSRTQTGELLGTPSYMAPEQAASRQQAIGAATDVYALGAILYEMLTGRPPFKAESPLETLRQVMVDEPVAPSRLQPKLSRDLETICLKCLRKESSQRYSSGLALADDLERFLEGRTIVARRSSTLERTWRWCLRNRAVALLLACVAGLLVTIAVAASVLAARLAVQRDRANWNSRRAQIAERDSLAKLGDSYLAQARAGRFSGRVGQRFGSLDALAKAARIARSLDLPAARLAELRDEAIACLALPDLKPIQQWDYGTPDTVSVAIDSDLERYARVSRDGSISLRSVADDRELLHLDKAGYLPRFSKGGRYLGAFGIEPSVKIWNLERGNLVVTFEGRRAWDFSPRGDSLALSQNDGTLLVFNLATCSPAQIWTGSTVYRIISFSPDGRRLAALGEPPQSIEIRDVVSGRILNGFPIPEAGDVVWHPDGKTLAIVGEDFKVGLWDVAAGARRLTLEGHRSGGVHAAFNLEGDLLASWGWDGKLRLWDPSSGKLLLKTACAGAEPAFGRDGLVFVPFDLDIKLSRWQIAYGREFRSLARPAYDATFRDVAIHPGGRLLAVGMEDGVGLWDLASSRELEHLPIGTTRHLLFDASGDLLTRGSYGLWRWPVRVDADSGTTRIGPPRKLDLPGNLVQFDVSRDGRLFGLAQFDGALAVDPSRPSRPVRFRPHADVRYVAVSPDGRWVATGSHSALGVKIWDSASGKLEAELPCEAWSEVAFSSDGRWLAAGHFHCRVWEVGSWTGGPQIGGGGLCFSPDSRLLAVETGAGVVRLVDPATGREIVRLEDPKEERAHCGAFSPDGALLVLSSADSAAIHVWNLRAIGKELEAIALGWELPPFSDVSEQQPPPLRVEVTPRR